MCLKSDSKTDRSTRAKDKVVLRKKLPDLLGYVGGVLGEPSRAQRLLLGSKNVPDYLTLVASELAPTDGTETTFSVEVLGILSDIALVRMTPSERKDNALSTPQAIVLWFRDYLVRTLDKKDLDWVQNNLKVKAKPLPSASPSQTSQSELSLPLNP